MPHLKKWPLHFHKIFRWLMCTFKCKNCHVCTLLCVTGWIVPLLIICSSSNRQDLKKCWYLETGPLKTWSQENGVIRVHLLLGFRKWMSHHRFAQQKGCGLTQQEGSCVQIKAISLTSRKPCWCFDLSLLISRTWGKQIYFLYHISFVVCSVAIPEN